MRTTIGYNQELHYQKIISRYSVTSSDEIKQTLQNALDEVQAAGYTPADDFFYSINSDIRNQEELLIQIFMPINESNMHKLSNEYFYQSYFQVLDLMSTRFKGADEEKSAEALGLLLETIVDQDLTAKTPLFFCPITGNEEKYTNIMIGVK